MVRLSRVLLTLIGVSLWMVSVGGVTADLKVSGTLDVVPVVGPKLSSSQHSNDQVSKHDAWLVELHNSARSQVGASNMEYTEHSGLLKTSIFDWTQRCRYEDAVQVYWDNGKYRNVFGFKAIFTTPIGVFSAMRRLVEDTDTDIHNVIFKSDVGYIGCAEHQCHQQNSSTYTLVSCLYASRSQLNLNAKPFRSGEPCSECQTEELWCLGNLCREDCRVSSNYTKCECKVDCGKYCSFSCLDNNSCRCVCDDKSTCSQGDTCGNKSSERIQLWQIMVLVSLLIFAVLCVCNFYYRKCWIRRLNSISTSVCQPRVSSPTISGPGTPRDVHSTASSSIAWIKPPPEYSSLPPFSTPSGPGNFYDHSTAAPSAAAEEVSEVSWPPPSPPPPYGSAEAERTTTAE